MPGQRSSDICVDHKKWSEETYDNRYFYQWTILHYISHKFFWSFADITGTIQRQGGMRPIRVNPSRTTRQRGSFDRLCLKMTRQELILCPHSRPILCRYRHLLCLQVQLMRLHRPARLLPPSSTPASLGRGDDNFSSQSSNSG